MFWGRWGKISKRKGELSAIFDMWSKSTTLEDVQFEVEREQADFPAREERESKMCIFD